MRLLIQQFLLIMAAFCSLTTQANEWTHNADGSISVLESNEGGLKAELFATRTGSISIHFKRNDRNACRALGKDMRLLSRPMYLDGKMLPLTVYCEASTNNLVYYVSSEKEQQRLIDTLKTADFVHLGPREAPEKYRFSGKDFAPLYSDFVRSLNVGTIELCNYARESDGTYAIAIAYYDRDDEQWVSRGWIVTRKGECKTILKDVDFNGNIYLYAAFQPMPLPRAEEEDLYTTMKVSMNAAQLEVIEGTTPFCIEPSVFKIAGEQLCNGPGQQRKMFRKLVADAKKNTIIELTGGANLHSYVR